MPIAVNDVRRDRFLENVLIANKNESFLADSLFTSKVVSKDTGEIGGISDDHLRIYESERSLYDRSRHEMEFEYTNPADYKIGYHDLSIYVPKRLQEQAENPFMPRRDAGIVALNALRLRRENDLAAQLTSTSVLTQNTTLSGSSQFQDAASQPETVIQNAMDTIQAAIGAEANSILLGRKVFMTLKRHPFFLSMISGLSVLSEEKLTMMLKDHFGFENVFVGRSIKVTSKAGQTVTKGAVWNNDVVVFRKGSGDFDQTLGFNLGLSGYQMKTVVYEDPIARKGDFVEVENAWQDKVVSTPAGFLIKDAVA